MIFRVQKMVFYKYMKIPYHNFMGGLSGLTRAYCIKQILERS